MAIPDKESRPHGLTVPFDQGSPAGIIEVDISDDQEEQRFREIEELGTIEPESHFENLVRYISPRNLRELGSDVIEGYEADDEARQEYLQNIRRGLSNLGLEYEELQYPFKGACSASHPIIVESAVKFQSKASNELFPAGGPVKSQIMGDITPDKEKQATRVKNFLNWNITSPDRMHEYVPDGEKLLFYLALVGTGIRKVEYLAREDRPCVRYIPIDDFVVADNCNRLADAYRYTEVTYPTKLDLLLDEQAGLYELPSTGLGAPSRRGEMVENIRGKQNEIMGFDTPNDRFNESYKVLRQYTYAQIPEFDGLEGGPSPYVISVDLESGMVLEVRRNWKKNDHIHKRKIDWCIDYHFVPSFGFHSLGFIHLLGNIQFTLTAVLRSLVDSGQFANLQGGWKLKGLRITGDNRPIAPGTFRDIETHVDDIKKAIYPLPFKEPSTVLFNMYQFLEERAQRFADSTEQVIADSTNYGPVGTTLALLEASTKFYSAIHKRLHASQKKELDLISYVLQEFVINNEYPYDVPGESRTIFETDFDERIDIIPVSDPNIPSNAHRMAIAQTQLQLMAQVPQIADLREGTRTVLQAMGADNVDKLVPPEESAIPRGPVEDIAAAVEGKPIKAFPGQDHAAHIQVESAWMQDPMNGGNELMQPAVPAIMAHIREHVMLKYKEELAAMVEQMAGQQLPEDANAEQVIAMAGQALAQLNQQVAAAGGGEDPMAKMAAAEMLEAETKAEEAQWKKMKEMAELQLKDTDQQHKHAIEKAKVSLESDKVAAGLTTSSLQQQDKELDRQMKKADSVANRESAVSQKELDAATKLAQENIKADSAERTERIKGDTATRVARSRPKPTGI